MSSYSFGWLHAYTSHLRLAAIRLGGGFAVVCRMSGRFRKKKAIVAK